MSQAVQPTAIETRYLGHRFRSRLEARWAVFFETLGIKWRYEPQGYMVAGQPYLPDFWLPDLELWVEVKGFVDRESLAKLAAAAGPDGLPLTAEEGSHRPCEIAAGEFDWRTTASPQIPRLLLLGDIPGPPPVHRSSRGWVHELLCLVSGRHVVSQLVTWLAVRESPPRPVLMKVDSARPLGADPHESSPHGLSAWWLKTPPVVQEAYAAARAARFEHGEQG